MFRLSSHPRGVSGPRDSGRRIGAGSQVKVPYYLTDRFPSISKSCLASTYPPTSSFPKPPTFALFSNPVGTDAYAGPHSLSCNQPRSAALILDTGNYTNLCKVLQDWPRPTSAKAHTRRQNIRPLQGNSGPRHTLYHGFGWIEPFQTFLLPWAF